MADATQSEKNSTITYEDILKLFKETDRQIKEADARLDKRIKETDKKFKKIAERFKETDEKFKEVAEGFKEAKQIVKETSKSVGSLGNTWGEFIEGLVAPAALRLFRERGYAVNEIHTRVKSDKYKRDMEIDILVVNENFAILIEIKSTLRVDDIDEHLKKLVDFKFIFSTYKEKKYWVQ